MSNLRHSDQVIINELIDHQVFMSSVTAQTSQKTAAAIESLKHPGTQQRISHYLNELIGQHPGNYQENLVLLVGTKILPPLTIHILLATLKAVINLPELQNTRADRVVLAETVVRQVHSEVTECDERVILRQINALFVDQLGLLTLDQPATPPRDQLGEVQDYWDVNPNFTFITQCLVDELMSTDAQPQLTPIQQLNSQLLTQRYLSRKSSAELWQVLTDNRTMIAEQWAQLDRFALEVGDDYALLLDQQRTPSEAKPFVIAIVVAHALGSAGVPQDELTALIKQTMADIPAVANLTTTQVKQALFDYDLVAQTDGFVSPTPLVARFEVKPEEAVIND